MPAYSPTTNTTIHVSIIEDDPGVRREFQALLDNAPGFRCLQAYPDAETALLDLPQNPPDLALMDINLPGMSGIDCVRQLKQLLPDLPVVMLTVHEDSDTLFESLTAGASGYLVKRTPRPRLLEELRELFAGGAPMSRGIARKVIELFHRASSCPTPVAQPAEVQTLTPREQQILASLAKGHSYKEIGWELGISGDTTRKHMGHIYQKLQVHSRTEALLKYLGR